MLLCVPSVPSLFIPHGTSRTLPVTHYSHSFPGQPATPWIVWYLSPYQLSQEPFASDTPTRIPLTLSSQCIAATNKLSRLRALMAYASHSLSLRSSLTSLTRHVFLASPLSTRYNIPVCSSRYISLFTPSFTFPSQYFPYRCIFPVQSFSPLFSLYSPILFHPHTPVPSLMCRCTILRSSLAATHSNSCLVSLLRCFSSSPLLRFLYGHLFSLLWDLLQCPRSPYRGLSISLLLSFSTRGFSPLPQHCNCHMPHHLVPTTVTTLLNPTPPTLYTPQATPSVLMEGTPRPYTPFPPSLWKVLACPRAITLSHSFPSVIMEGTQLRSPTIDSSMLDFVLL